MRHLAIPLVLLVTAVAFAAEAPKKTTDLYVLGADSKPQPGVPKGKITKSTLVSKIYDGRTFTYQVYVPAQYDGSKAACVFIGQDGNNFVREINEQTKQPGAWQVPVVFDNLIHKKEIPVTIGIFIDPTSRRSEEYDTLSDRYARFVIDEILPEVSKSYKLTDDPEGRAVGGFSSGAICAFTMAWERPDAFRKVASFFGSYTSIAYRPAQEDRPMQPGGDLYPTLIRKTGIKPLTVFIQDGSNDLNNEHGSWYLANQQMVSALEYANANPPGRGRGGRRGGGAPADAPPTPTPQVQYRVQHAFGDGGHTANHGGSIFPDVMRFLFKGYEPKG
ncbi:MAG: alpha/beta hydrolase-fold protein [Opitutaceae bacterium]